MGGNQRSGLGRAIRQIWGPESERPAGVSAYEQVTRERVDGLKGQVDRIELKINGLLVALVAAVVGEVYRMVVK
jgi:hypothetical protein